MAEERVYDPRFPYEEANALLLSSIAPVVEPDVEPESIVDGTVQVPIGADTPLDAAPARPSRVRN